MKPPISNAEGDSVSRGEDSCPSVFLLPPGYRSVSSEAPESIVSEADLSEGMSKPEAVHRQPASNRPGTAIPRWTTRTALTPLLSDGMPLLYVSKQLGHSKSDTTIKYYAHWIPDAGEHFVNQLDLGKVGTKLAPNAENEAPTEIASIAQEPESIEEENWSRRSGLNRRPADYESAALPLSYAGAKGRVTGEVGSVL